MQRQVLSITRLIQWTSVSYNDIQVFLEIEQPTGCQYSKTGWEYALPTEAEWEYACRAGTSSTYSWGSSISSTNTNYNTTIGNPVTVGQYAANAWGLFDMHGNVFEWTADWSGTYDSGTVIDPEQLSGTQIVCSRWFLEAIIQEIFVLKLLLVPLGGLIIVVSASP